MPLTNVQIRPGLNKSDTPSGAEGQWIDSDFVRFRYGQPEKIGGFEAIGQKTISGPARAQHCWNDLEGRKYAALGTSKALYIYYEDAFYDITPLSTAITGATFTSTNGSSTVTVNKATHNLIVGEYVTFTSVTVPGATTTLNGAINDSVTTITLTDASSFSTSGSVRIEDEIITYSGKSSNDLTGCTRGASGTTAASHADTTAVRQSTVTRFNTTDFTANTFEILTVATNSFTITMPISETGTGMSAAGGASINPYEEIGPTIQTYGYGWGTSTWGTVGWGNQTTSSQVVLDPGSWSLDNFGQQLIATIKDGKTFVWDAGAANPLENRATIMTGAPTSSRLTIVSDRDRHVVHFGTETTIGDSTTQDPMFIRFSDQENYNVYQPTSINTAGTFRLDTGNKIVAAVSGKDYNLILTDTAAYIMQFVGPPFTFSIRQVGSNCGCIGQHAVVYADGQVFWMGTGGGFFKFDGTVKLLPSLVEDFVFTTTGDNIGVNYSSNEIIYASHNSLFNEIVWFYPSGKPLSNPATQNNRSVVYNYVENVWSIMTLERSTYHDASTYDQPYATEYTTTATPTVSNLSGATNTFGASKYFAQEVGTNIIDLDGTETPIAAFIQSGDFDIPTEGDGQFLMRISRFLPDFKNLQGNAIITIGLKDFPIDTNVSSQLGPFTVSSSTQKIDTRARGRLANLKIENTANDETWRFGTFRVDVNADGRR
jgi:hypothetical protein|tara:strand:- start:167 stop:2302 length:2136 start_codon:yes stop_codon:yes gene_type:complete